MIFVKSEFLGTVKKQIGILCVKEKRMKLLVIDIQKGITDSRLLILKRLLMIL